jgi:hypothetical protein
MLDGRRHQIGPRQRRSGWNRLCRTGFSMAESLLFIIIFDRLTETTRYWGHEHDYRNNLISVRLGGVVPREVPCNKKEAVNLRDGPFSGFRPSSNASLEKGASGETQLKDKEKNALSKANVEALGLQETQAKQVSAGPRVDEPPVTGTDEEDEAENEFNDTHPETDRNPGEAEEEIEPTLETDDIAHLPRWESQILCVIDPFIREKVMLLVIYYARLTDTTFLIAEPRRKH